MPGIFPIAVSELVALLWLLVLSAFLLALFGCFGSEPDLDPKDTATKAAFIIFSLLNGFAFSTVVCYAGKKRFYAQ